MKRKGLILSCVMVFCLMVGVFSAGAAFQMGLEATTDGSTVSNEFAVGTATNPTYLYLNIHLDAEESGVAACAFTLNYDPTYLEAPATNTDGLPTTADDVYSAFPFATTVGTDTTKTHRVNSATSGTILFSGAEITEQGGSKTHMWDVPLFTVKFKVKDTAPTGDAIFSLSQTILTNEAAGWNGEGVPILVGAVPNTDSRFGGDLSDDFPILLENFSDPAPSLTVAIVGGTIAPYDVWRQGFISEGKADIGGETEDYDRDGYSNYDEMENGTDPYAKNEETQFPEDYDEVWDNRVSHLDVDGNGKASLGQDGMIALRYMAGKRGTALLGTSVDMDGSDGTICTRCTATEIEAYLAKMYNARPCPLDVDDSGKPALGQDGMIILRYMAGKRGTALLGTSVDTVNCNRCTAPEIEDWIKLLFPGAMP